MIADFPKSYMDRILDGSRSIREAAILLGVSQREVSEEIERRREVVCAPDLVEAREPRRLFGDEVHVLDWAAEDEDAYRLEIERGVSIHAAERRIERLVARALDLGIWHVADGKLVKEPPPRKAA